MVRLDVSPPDRVVAHIEVRSSLDDEIRRRQFEDPALVEIRERVLRGDFGWASVDSDGVLRVHGRLAVPQVGEILQTFLREIESLADSLVRLDVSPPGYASSLCFGFWW